MSIPDEAVEAAVAAYLAEYNYNAEEIVQLVLEAAAPYIIKAWINDTSRLPEDLPGYGPEGRIK